MSASILLYGRDDDYMPTYMDRVSLCVRSFSKHLAKVDHEIILVDINQVPGRPLGRHFEDIPSLVNVVVSPEEYKQKFREHFDRGVVLTKSGINVNDSINPDHFLSTTWATNYALNMASKDYVIICSTDLFVTEGLSQFVDNLCPNVLYKILTRSAPFSLKPFRALLADEKRFQKWRQQVVVFDPKVLERHLVGNGLMLAIDRRSAVEMGGYLPYLMHRGKGCDLFFSYICDAFGKRSMIPHYVAIEMNHPKVSTSEHIWDRYRIYSGNEIKFDFRQSFGMLKGWIKKHLKKNVSYEAIPKMQPYVLSADRKVAERIISAFSPISWW